jgi:hypothetical protein
MADTFVEGVVSSDILQKETSDGVRLIELWEETQTLINELNSKRLVVEDFLGYRRDTPEADATSSSTSYWMRRGEHTRANAKATITRDLAVLTAMESFETHLGWTRDAEVLALTSGYVRGRIRSILEGDARSRYIILLESLYTAGTRLVVDVLTQQPVNLYSAYYGTGDTRVPPTRGVFSFSANHNHFFRTATQNVVTAADLETLGATITEHGYTANPIIFFNEDMWDEVLAVGEPDVAVFKGTNRYVPRDEVNINQEGALMQISLGVNPLFRAVGTFRGVFTLMITPEAPLGYLGAFSHQGDLSAENPVQIREPEQANLRGVRPVRESLVYFVNTYFERYYSAAVRTPGNFAAMQVKNWSGGAYVSPDWGDY